MPCWIEARATLGVVTMEPNNHATGTARVKRGLAEMLKSLGVDYVDESEVLSPADEAHHIDKWAFTVPFVCGATSLGEALRRISEGAAMIRSKGEAGTGDVKEVADTGRLPVPLFCAGGIATPADAALVMQLGAEAVFVGSGIFKSDDPETRAKAIVEATAHYDDPQIVAKVSRGLGEPMRGEDAETVQVRLAE